MSDRILADGHRSEPMQPLVGRRGAPAALSVVLRVAAAVLGGYCFAGGLAALGIVALVTAGMNFHEAEHAAMLLAFLVFLAALLWAVAGRSLLRVWAVLAGGGAGMGVAAWWLQRGLLG